MVALRVLLSSLDSPSLGKCDCPRPLFVLLRSAFENCHWSARTPFCCFPLSGSVPLFLLPPTKRAPKEQSHGGLRNSFALCARSSVSDHGILQVAFIAPSSSARISALLPRQGRGIAKAHLETVSKHVSSFQLARSARPVDCSGQQLEPANRRCTDISPRFVVAVIGQTAESFPAACRNPVRERILRGGSEGTCLSCGVEFQQRALSICLLLPDFPYPSQSSVMQAEDSWPSLHPRLSGFTTVPLAQAAVLCGAAAAASLATRRRTMR